MVLITRIVIVSGWSKLAESVYSSIGLDWRGKLGGPPSLAWSHWKGAPCSWGRGSLFCALGASLWVLGRGLGSGVSSRGACLHVATRQPPRQPPTTTTQVIWHRIWRGIWHGFWRGIWRGIWCGIKCEVGVDFAWILAWIFLTMFFHHKWPVFFSRQFSRRQKQVSLPVFVAIYLFFVADFCCLFFVAYYFVAYYFVALFVLP